MVSRLEKLMQKSKGTGWLAKIPYEANRPLGLFVGLSISESMCTSGAPGLESSVARSASLFILFYTWSYLIIVSNKHPLNCEGSFPAFLSSNYLLFFLPKVGQVGDKICSRAKTKSF